MSLNGGTVSVNCEVLSGGWCAPDTTLGDLRIVALELTFALGLNVVEVVEVVEFDSVRFIGDGGRGEFVREGGFDVEAALYVILTVTCPA